MSTYPTPDRAPAESAEAAGPTGLGGAVHRVLRDSLYAFTGFFLALVSWVVMVTLLSFGVGTLVIAVGLFVLGFAALAARGLASVERTRLRTMLGIDAQEPVYLRAAPEAGAVARTLARLRDPQSWLDVLWSLFALVPATLAFTVIVTWWAGILGGLTFWFWQQWLPEPDNSLAEIIGLGAGRGPEIALNLFFGLFALVTLPWAARFSAAVQSSVSRVMLSSRADLQQQVQQVEVRRADAHAAEAQSLRRLERDIHDGPQQRLVRLSMDLGRARRQLDDDPVRARETLDAALSQTRETVEELRSLSRGIAPPLLVDRGLRVALAEMTSRSVVPVHQEYLAPERLPDHVETAVYFVVAEALTNMAKHSGADHASVRVVTETDVILVEVVDNGVGGASEAKGFGLAGLAQRLRGVDGILNITSPPGGPTRLVAEIPVRPKN